MSLADSQSISYCERFLEFMLDLISQLPTRRFFHALLSDTHLTLKCQLSQLSTSDELANSKGKLFNQLLEMLRFYETFEVNNYTGLALTESNLTDIHSAKIQQLQVKFTFRQYLNLFVANCFHKFQRGIGRPSFK